jgi:hypothetical protein
MDDGLQIITEETGREDLLRHIAALERRLECDRVYVLDETLPRTPENPLQTRERVLSPEERVEMIRNGSDGIGCRDLTIALLEERHLDPEAPPLRKPAARLLRDLIEAAKGIGYAEGFRAARDTVASSRALADGVEINLPKGQLVDLLDASLTRFGPEAAEKGALLDRVTGAVDRSLSRPDRGRAE